MIILFLVILNYQLIDELSLRGVWITRFPSTKPYSWNELYCGLEGATSHDRTANWLLERLRTRWYKEKGYSFKFTGKVDTVKFCKSNLCGWVRTGNVFALAEPSLKFGKDGFYPDHYWNEIATFDYTEGFIEYYSHKEYSVFMGRSHLEWGPSLVNNLVLSGNNPLFDAFNGFYILSNIKLSLFFTQLNDAIGDSIEYEGDTLITPVRVSRYLTGHRIEASFAPRFVMGFSEVVLHSSPAIYYLIPILFYFPYEVNNRPELNHNYVWGFDLRFWFEDFSVYGEILVDDFQYMEGVGKEPNHLGLNCGIKFVDPIHLKGALLTTEYTCASRWVFTHPITWHRYHYKNYPIGHPLAPDFDRFYIEFLYHISHNIDLSLISNYVRHGEGRITSKWPIPFPLTEDSIDFPKNNFLSGVVEKKFNLSVGSKLFISPATWIEINVGYEKIWNYGNLSDKEKGGPLLVLNFGTNL